MIVARIRRRGERVADRIADEQPAAGKHLEQDDAEGLDRDLTIEPGVGRAPDLSHSAFAEPAGDFVRSELRASGQAH